MDEIDAIGGRRFSEGTSADREIQRTLMEVIDKSTDSETFLIEVKRNGDFLIQVKRQRGVLFL
jgi:ATP-dependent 26S proteasome regulatory subunit